MPMIDYFLNISAVDEQSISPCYVSQANFACEAKNHYTYHNRHSTATNESESAQYTSGIAHIHPMDDLAPINFKSSATVPRPRSQVLNRTPRYYDAYIKYDRTAYNAAPEPHCNVAETHKAAPKLYNTVPETHHATPELVRQSAPPCATVSRALNQRKLKTQLEEVRKIGTAAMQAKLATGREETKIQHRLVCIRRQVDVQRDDLYRLQRSKAQAKELVRAAQRLTEYLAFAVNGNTFIEDRSGAYL